jgi:arylsulfatase A-like enzyme
VLLILADDQGYSDIGYEDPTFYSPTLNGSSTRWYVYLRTIQNAVHGSLCYIGCVSAAHSRVSLAGVKLKGYHASISCTPTRAALMTGRYVNNVGMQNGAITPNENRSLPLQFTLLPQVLAQGLSSVCLCMESRDPLVIDRDCDVHQRAIVRIWSGSGIW